MKQLSRFSPFQIEKIIERHIIDGESLPKIADSVNIDRITLFNFKNEYKSDWESVEKSLTQDIIHDLIRKDQQVELSEQDTVRINLCLYMMKYVAQNRRFSMIHRDRVIEYMIYLPKRANFDKTELYQVFQKAGIESIEDAKETVETFEKHTGLILPESPPHPTNGKGPYHV